MVNAGLTYGKKLVIRSPRETLAVPTNILGASDDGDKDSWKMLIKRRKEDFLLSSRDRGKGKRLFHTGLVVELEAALGSVS